MSRIIQSDEFRDLCDRLRRQPAGDSVGDWPVQQLQWLGAAGGWRWNMPESCGGLGCSAVEMLQIYQQLSACCLTTALVLTQRNAACQRLLQASAADVSPQLLQDLAAGRVLATVGISQLTTSGQFLDRPAVLAEPVAGGWKLTGTVPWATGVASSQLMVTGATTESGLELLALVRLPQDGVTVQPPAELMGLSAACTSEVWLSGVDVRQSDILQGPCERVLAGGCGEAPAAGSLTTSAVALGFAERALAGFSKEAEQRKGLVKYEQRMRELLSTLQEVLVHIAEGVGEGSRVHPEQLRFAANDMALRVAQAWLAVTRGTGYHQHHPASRAMRESLFFQVWSCPRAVLKMQLDKLAPDPLWDEGHICEC